MSGWITAGVVGLIAVRLGRLCSRAAAAQREAERQLGRERAAHQAAIGEARQQGYADGLTEGYRRGRYDLRAAVERARLFGYDEALADQELANEEGGA